MATGRQGHATMARALLLLLAALALAAVARAFRPAAAPRLGPPRQRRPLLLPQIAPARCWTRTRRSSSPAYLLSARLHDDNDDSSSRSIRDSEKRNDDPIDYRRPKALKEPIGGTAMASSDEQQQQEQPSELWVLMESLRLLACRAFLDPFTRPPPIDNYALLIGDLSVLLSFRSVEDTLLTPLPTLDITASPDMIAKGLITYGDPLHAAAHIYRVVADGMTLGLFWLLAVMWGEAEAVDSATSRSFTLSALNVFKSWLALCNTRLAMLFFQAMTVGEGVNLSQAQMELSALLLTLLGWRWLNVAVLRRFTD